MQNEAYILNLPVRRTTPVVVASPHSGRDYPADFLRASVLDQRLIRSSEDAFVDELVAVAPQLGAPLMLARAPRAFIDLNRGCDELDPAVIEGVARNGHNPRIASGLGVIPRVVAGGRSIYRGKLSREEAETRIARFWRPYHARLDQLLAESHRDFGMAVLVDFHSMPHEALETYARPGKPRPDVVLGDRFGATVSPDVMDQIEAAFVRAGLRVSRNTPFAGAFITQTYGRPSRGFHAVQVEIDRSLYMNESAIEKLPCFDAVQAMMSGVIGEICALGQPGQALAAE